MKQDKRLGIVVLVLLLFTILLFSKSIFADIYENDTITFVANYTNLSSGEIINNTQGNCTIVFSDSPATIGNMTYNEITSLYLYNKSFLLNGTYQYNISCFSLIFSNKTNYYSISIQIRPLPVPVLWPVPGFTDRNNFNIIGYTNRSYASVFVFRIGSPYSENSTFINSDITDYGSAGITAGSSPGSSTLYVTDGTLGMFQTGRYLVLSGHNRTNFIAYEITGSFETTGDPASDEVYITPALESDVSLGELVWVRDSEYPRGWFNLSINLSAGYNNISSRINYTRAADGLNVWSTQSLIQSIFLDNQMSAFNLSSVPSIINSLTPVIRFNITDDYKINITSLLINVTNRTSTIYYAYDSNIFGSLGTFGNNITCSGTDTLQNCYVQLNLTQGSYNITFQINDSVGNKNTTLLSNYTIDTAIGKIALVQDEGITIYNTSMYFNWSALGDASGINHYEYLLWVYYFNDSTTRINLTDWNSTAAKDAAINMSFVIDGNYFLDVRAVDNAGNIGNSTSSDGIFFVDVSTPVCDNCVHDEGSWTNDMSLFAWWNFSEQESAIINYKYWIGNNTCFLADHDSLKGETLTSLPNATFAASNLQNNMTYYFNVIAKNSEQIRTSESNCYSSNGIQFDNVAPSNGSISYPTGNLSSSIITLELSKGFDNLSGLARAELYQAKTPINIMTGACGSYNYNLLAAIDLDLTSFVISTEDGYCYRFQYKVFDNAGNSVIYSSSSQGQDTKVDTTSPSGVTVVDEGTLTNNKQLHANWTYASDLNSGIAYYLYTIGSHQNSSDLLGGQWKTTAQNDATEYNLSMNDSITYYFTVIAVNYIGLYGPESYSDGITYFDNVAPAAVTIVSVGNDTDGTDGYYDTSVSNNVTVLISGEEAMTCVYSLYDIPYTDYPDNNNLTLGYCGNTAGNLANCTINAAQGNWTYYIVCKDYNGNAQNQNQNTKVIFVKDYSLPIITINSPNTITTGGFVKINATISDFSALNISRYVIYNNSPGSQHLMQQIANGTLSNGQATWDSTFLFNTVQNLTILAEAEDYTGFYSNATANFTLDNTVPYIILTTPNYVNDNFNITFNITLFSNFTYDISYNGEIRQIVSNNSDADRASLSVSYPVNISNQTYWHDGFYNITAYAISSDKDNTTLISWFRIDRVAPLFSNSAISPEIIYNNDRVNISIDISDISPVDWTKAELNSTGTLTNHTAVSNAEITWNLIINSSSLRPNMTMQYRWIADDSAGNIDYSEWFNFTVLNRGLSFSAIPNQSFKSNESLLLNLSNYTVNDDNDNLSITYAVSDSNVIVSVNNLTKTANISTLSGWYGNSWIIFNASDPYGESNISNQINLEITYAAPQYYCGDGSCSNGETCNSCSADCGACPRTGGGGGGGSVIVKKPNCTDGIKNGNETEIDCGGQCKSCFIPLPEIKPSCSDGIQNQEETGIDCGGPCSACFIPEQTPTCSDGIQNQEETGIDCGGPCESCKIVQEEKPVSFSWIGWLIGLFIFVPLLVLAGLFMYRKYHEEQKPVLVQQQVTMLKPLTETEYEQHKEDFTELPEFELKKNSQYSQLYEYVKSSLDKGKTRMDIRRELLVEGWSEKQINKVLKQITYHQRIAELEDYINYSYGIGYTKGQVRQNLLDASWSEEIVDLVLHDVHNIHDDLDKVKEYVRHRIGMGHSMDDIRETLLRIGWDHKVIEPMLDYGVYAVRENYNSEHLND